MTLSLKHVSIPLLLALGACNQTAQPDGPEMFFGDAGTHAALTVAGVASGFDPTGISSFALAHASRAALLANFEKQSALQEQRMQQQHDMLLQIRDNARRARKAHQEKQARGGQTAGASPAEAAE